MRSPIQRAFFAACLILGFVCAPVQAQDNVLTMIPDDAIAFVVVHNVAEVNRSIGEVAKLVHAPIPDLLPMAKLWTGFQKGLDESGDFVVILTAIDPAPKLVLLMPVANFEDLFASVNVKSPEKGVVEVQLQGKPMLVGRKGHHAVLARPGDREALEKYLPSTNNLASDKSLATWIDANKISIVVPSSGLTQLLPKLVAGMLSIQAQLGAAAGDNGKSVSDALQLYVDLFNAAETEVDQFGLGVRIDLAQTVSIVKRVQFTPAGEWAEAVAKVKPASEDLLGGLESKPFVLAAGGIVPQGAMHQLMTFSMKMMQNQPLYNLTPEQAKKYADLSSQAMRSVRTMRILLGVPDPKAGLYSNTTFMVTVDDSNRYLDEYEKSLTEMRKLAEESKSAAIPTATVKRIRVGETDGLEVSMTMPEVKQAAPPGGPDAEKMMKLFSGPEGTLKIYVAPADEHAVFMSYASLERLKSALEFYKSKNKGLSADPGVAKLAAALPPGSQVVTYISLSGAAKLAQQVAATLSPDKPAIIPDIPESPPIGMAVKISPSGVEGFLVITSDTLRTIGETIAKTRKERAKPPAAAQ